MKISERELKVKECIEGLSAEGVSLIDSAIHEHKISRETIKNIKEKLEKLC